jgi:hypothetical protein
MRIAAIGVADEFPTSIIPGGSRSEFVALIDVGPWLCRMWTSETCNLRTSEKTPSRNCPKRGASNAPMVNLTVITEGEWAESLSLVARKAAPRTPPTLFGQFL